MVYFLMTSKRCVYEKQGSRSAYSQKIDTPITKIWAICKCFSPAISRVAYKVYKQAFWASFALSPEIFASVLVPSGGALFHRGSCCLCSWYSLKLLERLLGSYTLWLLVGYWIGDSPPLVLPGIRGDIRICHYRYFLSSIVVTPHSIGDNAAHP